MRFSEENRSEFLQLLIDRHNYRVGLAAREMAKSLNFSEQEVEEVSVAGAHHDVGKYYIPTHILFKADKLSTAEFDIMRLHPLYTAVTLYNEGYSDKIIKIASQHHENWDGSGYPFGLRGNEIERGARLLRIVDEFDALIEYRPYRRSPSYEMIMKIMEEDSKHFDQDMYKEFRRHSLVLFWILSRNIQLDIEYNRRFNLVFGGEKTHDKR